MSQRMPPNWVSFQNQSGRAEAPPASPPALLNLVGSDIDSLNDLTDSPLLDELPGMHRGRNFQSLRVHDAVDTPGLCAGPPDQRQILQGGDARLVR